MADERNDFYVNVVNQIDLSEIEKIINP